MRAPLPHQKQRSLTADRAGCEGRHHVARSPGRACRYRTRRWSGRATHSGEVDHQSERSDAGVVIMPCSDRHGSTPGMPAVRFVGVGSGHATDTARRMPMRSGSAYGVSAMVSRQNRACRVMARPPEPPVTFKRSVPDQPRPGCSGSARQDDRRRLPRAAPPAYASTAAPVITGTRRATGRRLLAPPPCVRAQDKKAGEDFGAGRVGPVVAEGPFSQSYSVSSIRGRGELCGLWRGDAAPSTDGFRMSVMTWKARS